MNELQPGPGTPVRGPIRVAVFGKHPAWSDHMDGIGLDDAGLGIVHRQVYVEGIGAAVESGELGSGFGFNHTFLWQTSSGCLLGRIWSSCDAKGRDWYPMVLCARFPPRSPAWLVDTGLPWLIQAEAWFKQVDLAADVERIAFSLEQHLGAVQAGGGETEPVRFREDTKGLRRLRQQLRDASSPVHVRVPVSGHLHAREVAWWSAFAMASGGGGGHVLFMLQCLSAPWLDLVNGNPSQGQLVRMLKGIDQVPIEETDGVPLCQDAGTFAVG